MFFDDNSSAIPSDLVLDAKVADASKLKFRGSLTLNRETKILALRPELPRGTKSIEVDARKPDGRTEVLLFAKDFRADWPTPYILQKPVTLPAGTALVLVAYSTNPQSEGVRLTLNRIESSK